MSNIDLKNGFVWGSKGGFYLPGRMDFHGVELDAYNANPHIQQQSATAKLESSSTKLDALSSNYLRGISTALNLMVDTPVTY